MASQIQIRRDNAANWTNTNPVLAQGEFGLDLTNMDFKIGDGNTNWISLSYTSDKGYDIFTPLTLTNTLTSQLVLNTDFDSYKTSVASATATLLPTTVYQSASGNWQDTYTNVQSNSSNWDFGYDVATTYQNASGSFATNTLLQSTSALLTPLTLTNTLTGQLVLNTDFNSYKTNVAAATATLLPTTIYQSASGDFATNTLLQSTSALLTPLTTTNTLTGQLVLNTDFNSYKTNVASATATLLPTTIYQSASGAFIRTVTTTSPGTSAVTTIVAVSAVPVVQQTGVLYIVV